jgi:drug/metabolite transporter (DMT)-like permease
MRAQALAPDQKGIVGRAVQQRQTGLMFGLAGYMLLSIGDAVVKTTAGEWPGTGFSALRFAIGAVVIGLIVALTQGRAGFAVPRMHLQIARGMTLGVGALCFYLSLFVMPLAEATAIGFAAPMVIALLSARLLGERIARASWAAMVLATIGVLIILRPNVALLGWGALLPVVAMVAMAIFLMLNRATANDVSPLAAQFWVALWVTPLQAAVALVGHYSGARSLVFTQLPSPDIIARCCFVALSASGAHLLLFTATRRVSAATMAPTSYVQIIMAIGLGILLFNQPPDAVAMAGIALIVTAGLVLWYAGRAPSVDPMGEGITP